ncbi:MULTISPECIES: helix-turn-helix transcriptional regulator [Aerococcus]|uniref:Helix-turn-helix transcriptional regulator n=1 Tax=Aerococcus sanguinicola TaxID=119206 RepID=A0A5N1GL78_9LACT|nr:MULTISPECIES: helix-turn-helix transcriptional regulator [Aerococcus]KAA9301737.1 helix-turn-helix transcriptional regulator [Aerococcus sanguinicola]MDK6368849.1 helix-turn-helix transcriptional regulator [Aerococcus sp. UMB9870]MDK6680187.1 helix-turn-helix transcriptional regulator [Aerococcus sp. UMB8608]MDK6685708.1 helix-turn-helix transcriptional regulator [Aerococcus sp. UMB8623]MDK6939473.1 helix-turn-helix transcriptional regulator [Aerococcus sp. UMB8487]
MLAENLKYLRQKNHYYQKDIARKLNRKTNSTISDWENGKYTPSLDVVEELAAIYHVGIDELLTEDLREKYQSPGDQLVQIFDSLDTDKQAQLLHYAQELKD